MYLDHIHAHFPLLLYHLILLEPFFLATYLFAFLCVSRISYMYSFAHEKLTSGYTTEEKQSLLPPAVINGK